MEKSNKMKLFDYIKAMTTQKLDLDFSDPAVSSGYNKFIINRLLSSSHAYTGVIDDFLNQRHSSNIPDEVHYAYLKSKLPKRYVKLKFPKSIEKDEELKYISDFFEVGVRDAMRISDELDPNVYEQIINSYKYGNGEMEEL